MKTHKTTFTSERAVKDFERIPTEQFAEASLAFQEYAKQATKVGSILYGAGIVADTNTALALLCCSVALLRSDNVSPSLVMETMGAFLAAAAGGIRPGGLPQDLAGLAKIREERMKLLLDGKTHTLHLELDDDVEGAPLTVIVQHVREPAGTYRLDVSVNFHEAARDPDSKAPEITLRTALEAAMAGVKGCLGDTTDPRAAN